MRPRGIPRYAKGVSRGGKVRQGQNIGYVRTTGNSTGPPLHFELIQNGKRVNPKKVTQLPKSKLLGTALTNYKSFITKIEKIKTDLKKPEMRLKADSNSIPASLGGA